MALHTNQNEKGVLEMDIGHLLVSTVLMAASKDRYLCLHSGNLAVTPLNSNLWVFLAKIILVYFLVVSADARRDEKCLRIGEG